MIILKCQQGTHTKQAPWKINIKFFQKVLDNKTQYVIIVIVRGGKKVWNPPSDLILKYYYKGDVLYDKQKND